MSLTPDPTAFPRTRLPLATPSGWLTAERALQTHAGSATGLQHRWRFGIVWAMDRRLLSHHRSIDGGAWHDTPNVLGGGVLRALRGPWVRLYTRPGPCSGFLEASVAVRTGGSEVGTHAYHVQ